MAGEQALNWLKLVVFNVSEQVFLQSYFFLAPLSGGITDLQLSPCSLRFRFLFSKCPLS
jgi:hypothetical protein